VNRLIAILVLPSLGGCTKTEAFSEIQFRQISQRCGFTAVTYTPHYSFWSKYVSNVPLIDFSREKDPKRAHKCFNDQLFRVPAAFSGSGSARVWDTRE
jgi:hypothetical protein